MRRGDARLQHLEPQGLVERAHFDAEAAREARTHALFERFEFTRRPVGGDDDLAARVDQRVQRVAELLLDRFAAQKLHVVDDQQVDAAQLLLEGDSRRGFERAGETVHEFFGGEIDHAPPLCRCGMGDRLQQMRFAEADRGVDVERVEAHGLAGRGAGDVLRRGIGELVRAADDEGREIQPPVERRAAERFGLAGRPRRCLHFFLLERAGAMRLRPERACVASTKPPPLSCSSSASRGDCAARAGGRRVEERTLIDDTV